MKDWPQMVPEDLRRRLETLGTFQARPGAAEIWGEVRDWLLAQGISPSTNTPADEAD